MELFQEGHQPPPIKLTLNLAPNREKTSPTQPTLKGYMTFSTPHLKALTRLLEQENGTVYLRVAIWDEDNKHGTEKYPIQGTIDFNTYVEMPTSGFHW